MNILFDYQALYIQKYGGISRYVFEVANGLRKIDGVNIDVKSLFSINHYFEKYYKKGSLKYYPKYTKKSVGYLNKLYILGQNKQKYDIIHPTYYDPYLINKFKGRLVITVHDMIHELFYSNQQWAKSTIENKKKCIYAADKIIAVSQCTKNDILKFYPDIPEDKIVVIYHGNSLKIGEMKNAKMHLPDNYILFMGNRSEYKNFFNYVRAVAPLIINNPNYYLVFGGGGNFTSDEIKLFKNENIFNNVIQLSYSDNQLHHVYSNAKCFVFPSIYEGFGIPILEAFGCKCPTVISKTSCFPEVAGDASEYFDPTNIVDMREKIESVVFNEEKRSLLISKGSQKLKDFSWEYAVQKTYELYRSLL